MEKGKGKKKEEKKKEEKNNLPKPCKCGSDKFVQGPEYDSRRPCIKGVITSCAVCGRERARYSSAQKATENEKGYSFRMAPRKGFGPQPYSDFT